ncbi:MAG: ABC transporter permease, partial [Geminicoccaceae bacterium]|nr:ABC transporter permease [Geminicoccaceae bacterium]
MTSTEASATGRAPAGRNWLLLFLEARTFVALILVLGYFSFAAPNFLSAANAVLVSKHVAINAFLAIGMT